VTNTELLKRHGYSTGHFGKWHPGPESDDGTYGIDTIEAIGKSRSPGAGRDEAHDTAAIDFIYPVDPPDHLVDDLRGVRVDRRRAMAAP
jgi:arylsulfatase A-like enzyme